MEKKPIIVLQVLGGLELGGAESRVMDIARNLNTEEIRYAFLVHTKGPDYYEEEANALGFPVYRVPRFRFFNYFAYKKAMEKFFQSHPEISIVQGHQTSTASIYLPIAKKNGMVTIAHARSAGVDKGWKGILTKFLRRNLAKKTDYRWACSSDAARAVYKQTKPEFFDAGAGGQKPVGYDLAPEKSYVLLDAISVEQFARTPEKDSVRKAIREKYNLTNQLVIGHVGRFHYAKNHAFLLQVFSEIVQIRPDARLLLVGDGGSLMEQTKQQVKDMGLEEKVIFTGRQSRPQDYYVAMDLMIFPSRYEGLPGTVTEAQASSLPCLISDTITRDVDVTDYVRYYSLKEEPKKWAEMALSYLSEINKPDKERQDPVKILMEKGFDVKTQVRMLEKVYRVYLENSKPVLNQSEK